MEPNSSTGLKRKLKRILHEAFKGSEVELDSHNGGKVEGSLIWKGFMGKDQIDRQLVLRDVIKAGLTSDELVRVSAILTFTPREVAVMDREAKSY